MIFFVACLQFFTLTKQSQTSSWHFQDCINWDEKIFHIYMKAIVNLNYLQEMNAHILHDRQNNQYFRIIFKDF